ncbi:DUF1674 domain-containing protein [Clohesyomyces aquaticus]|uniref:Succinate dehydrogenase assembly factor 4, mitochondrial n=1 Tax=Clohesyomyces aquaticus TaxID=1231657 RepID=A0A1Y1ZN17_9PLEO|nr:DUF1674 domain-containing protein [Clohesyomyces aquaticus]
MQPTYLQLPRRLCRFRTTYRPFSTSYRHNSLRSAFENAPAPPRLPKEEQEIFERLQKQSTGAFSTPKDTSSRDTNTVSSSSADVRMKINQSPDSTDAPKINIEGGNKVREGEELHPNIRRGAPPEFEGDVNPKTGEVGGPKNEPLRWGERGDWSYNGRVTDF